MNDLKTVELENAILEIINQTGYMQDVDLSRLKKLMILMGYEEMIVIEAIWICFEVRL